MAEVKSGNLSVRFKKFLREVKTEMKKVNWPSRKELTAYTGVVFVSVAAVAVVLWLFDSVLTETLRLLIHR